MARVLQRTLVLPVFPDSTPVVDVSRYISQECYRRTAQAVTFSEFRKEVCLAGGLPPPPDDVEAGPPASGPGPGAATSNSFCSGDDGAVLQLATAYSLTDYSGMECKQRHEDITNAAMLGIQVHGCKHVRADVPERKDEYSLKHLQAEFGGRPEKILMFLDLFGVKLVPAAEDLAATFTSADQVCGMLPSEDITQLSDAVMRALVPALPLKLSAPGSNSSDAIPDATGGGQAGAQLQAALQPAAPRGGVAGRLLYLAAHVRRADWWYYCAGGRNCFQSIVRVARCLNSTMARLGLSTVYIATNADAREREMLRTGISGRVLFWEDVTHALHQRQQQHHALEAHTGSGPAPGGDGHSAAHHHAGSTHTPRRLLLLGGDLIAGGRQARRTLAEATGTATAAVAGGMPADPADAAAAALQALQPVQTHNGSQGHAVPRVVDLGDELMVQILEKSICSQAAAFVPSRKSTFSRQIEEFRNGGLTNDELSVLAGIAGAQHLAPLQQQAATAAAELQALAEQHYAQCAELPRSDSDPSGGADSGPDDADTRHLADFWNANLFLEEVFVVWWWISGQTVQRHARPYALINVTEAAGAASQGTLRHLAHRYAQLAGWVGSQLVRPLRTLERLSLTAHDMNVMAAANRFVQIYLGGSFAGLVLEGTQHGAAASPSELAACVARAAAHAGVPSLYVSFRDVPEVQQALLMQALLAEPSLQHVTRLYSPEQERNSTFTMVWRGDGMWRREEPALLQTMPAALERVDDWILAKAVVLLGDPKAVMYRTVAGYRATFGFSSLNDGAPCG